MSNGLSPFGPAQLNVGMLATNLLAQNCPAGVVADKWALLRHCIAAKKRLAVSDRALTVLSALLSCYPETELRAEDNLIVFPSNRALAQRAHGISEPTLRRALAQLVKAQLLVRRDSPNGKRYARRGADGEIVRVFGFDLKPLLAQAARLAHLAADIEAERLQLRDLREQVTLLRRDMEKSFVLAEAGICANKGISALYAAYRASPAPIMRNMDVQTLETLIDELTAQQAQLTKCLTQQMNLKNMSGNDRHIERHKQDSNPNPILELEGPGKPGLEENSASQDRPALADAPPTQEREAKATAPLGLSTLLEACPAIKDYTTSGIGNWSELIEAGNLARGALGISPSAWDEAIAAMGQGEAAITVATILQRQSEISSPGGYLRALSAKAAVGKFTPHPIIQALLRRNLNQMAGMG